MSEGWGGGREAGRVGGPQDKGVGHPGYQVIDYIRGVVTGNGLGRNERGHTEGVWRDRQLPQ